MIIIVSINYLWIVISRKTDTTLKEFIILVPCIIHPESNSKHWIGLWKENNNAVYGLWMGWDWQCYKHVQYMFVCITTASNMSLDGESFLSHHKDSYTYFSVILTSSLKNNNLC